MLIAGILLACCRTPAPPPPAAHPEATRDQVEGAWDALLGRAVTPDGWVNYQKILREKSVLYDYIAWLSKPRPRAYTTKLFRHAIYVDAYNAFVIYGLLLDGLPAIVPPPAETWPGRAWDAVFERTFVLDGEPISLRQLKHELIRERVQDYRDLAWLVDGAASAPPMFPGMLGKRPLGPALDHGFQRWLMDARRGVRIAADGVLELPAALVPFVGDLVFQTGDDPLCIVLSRHLAGDLAEDVAHRASTGCIWRARPEDRRRNDVSLHRPNTNTAR